MTEPFATLEYVHVHLSERETAHRWPDGQWDLSGWEDCLFTSFVEVDRFAGGEEPASLTEAEALRAASGVSPQGPSSIAKAQIGMESRYGHKFRLGAGEAALLALSPGEAAVVAGSLANFPLDHTLRRWDPTYDAGHGIPLYRRADGWLWCDPLAPAYYHGQFVTDAQATTFMYNGSTFATARFNEFKEVPMLPFIDARAREVDLRAGAVLIDEDGRPVKTLTAQATVIAPYISDTTYSAVFASVGGRNVQVRAKRTDIVGAVRLPPEVRKLVAAARAAGVVEGKASVVVPPDTTPFTAADVTAKAGALLEQARSKSIEAVGKAHDEVAATLTEVVPHG